MKTIEKITKEKHFEPILDTVLISAGKALATNFETWIEQKTDMTSGLYYGAGIETNPIESKLSASDYPAPYDLGARLTRIDLDYETFIDYFDYLAKAMSKEHTRYYLNGIAFDNDALVATDGHRLHNVTIPSARFNHKDFVNGAICPADTVKYALLFAKEHKKQKPKVTISLHEKGFDFDFHDIGRVYSKLIDSNFPDWKRIEPKDVTLAQGTFDSRQFKKALKPIKDLQKIAGTKSLAITINGSGKALWQSNEFRHEFDISFALPEYGYNINFFIDTGLTSGDFYYNPGKNNGDPCKIEQGYKTAIIMPIRA